MTTALAPGLNQDEFQLVLNDAQAYLDGLRLADGLDPNIADKDGLVTYINGSSNPPPPELVEERNKIAVVLEGLCSIVTAAVLTKAQGESQKHDPAVWSEPLRRGLAPFISGYSDEQVKYQRTVRGVDVATQFLNILMAAVIEPGGALLSFKNFLAGQGQTIGLKGEGTKEGYKYACIGMVHEIFQIENGQWIYVPKIRMYFTSFNRETFKLSSACASYEDFKFDFQVQKLVAAFRIETWRQDEGFRKQVDDFIKKYTKLNIDQSENYFDGIFESKGATLLS